MSMSLLGLHIGFAGLWVGCVLTEALFERALLGKGRTQELILVELHKRVDLYVEIPAFCAVVITGILMFPSTAGGILLVMKVTLGLIAVVVNIYCVWLVWQRAGAAQRNEWSEFSRLDHKQHKYGAVVLLTLILTSVLGLSNV